MQHRFRSIVRKMTLRSPHRQLSDVVFGYLPIIASLSSVLLVCCGSNTAIAAEFQPLDDISAAAEAFLQHRLGRSDKQTTVRAGELDRRLRLALCEHELEPFMRRGAKIGNRTVVGVRCSGSKPWKVYLPVDVIVTENVLVARRTLPRDHLLTQEDLLLEQRDVSRMIAGYMTRPGELLGQRLKHQLIAGRIITPAMIQVDRVVRRGQSVTLTVQNNGLNIRMSGKALTDGAIGQRIRVENSKSGRVVEGIVRSPEHVEILIYSIDSFSNASPTRKKPADASYNFSNADPKESAISVDNKG